MDILKPQIKSRVLPLLHSVRGIALSRIAEEALIRDAEIDSEGEIEADEKGNIVYRGSTFLSIETDKLGLDIGGRGDIDTFLTVVSNSLRLRVRLMRLARREAERRSEPKLLTGMSVSTDFKIEGSKLLVDIDVECPLAMPRTWDGRNSEGQA